MKKESAYELEKKYMTQEEVARRFRVSPSTIKNWRDQGELEYFQPNGSSRVLYPVQSVEAFERRSTRQATAVESCTLKPAEFKKGKPVVSANTDENWRI